MGHPVAGLRCAGFVGRTRVYQISYRDGGKKVRAKIGDVQGAQAITLADARSAARQSMQMARAGVSPAQQKRESESGTVQALVERYLASAASGRDRKRGPMSGEYLAETKRALKIDLLSSFGDRQLRDITRGELKTLIDGVYGRGGSAANHLCAYIKAFTAWAAKQGHIDSDPASSIDKPGPVIKRTRYLRDNEIAAFWSACDAIEWPFGPLYKLLLLTGVRRDELANARWSEFDLSKGIWTLPGRRTKNGTEHILHLSPLAVAILESLPRIGEMGWVFTTGRRGDTAVNGWSKATERLRKQIGNAIAEPFTLHDLRRTAASGMAALQIAPHIIERILNHTIPGVAAIYNQHNYLSERKAAITIWSAHIESLCGIR